MTMLDSMLLKTHPKNYDRMLGRVLLKKLPEGDGAGGEDDFVRLHLLAAITGEGDVHELGLVSQVGEGCLDALLEVVPSQAKLFL